MRKTAIVGLPMGDVLLRFVDAALSHENGALVAARNDVRDAVGAAALGDVCATVASFQRRRNTRRWQRHTAGSRQSPANQSIARRPGD